MAVSGTTSLEQMMEVLAPFWLELSFMLFFLFGFALKVRTRGSKGDSAERETKRALHQQIVADVEAGHSGTALKTWHTIKSSTPVAVVTLKIVVQALLETDASSVVKEMVEYFRTHREALKDAKNVTAVLDALASAGRVRLMDEFVRELKQKLCFHPNNQIYEVLVGGHASAGDERRVSELCAEMTRNRQKLTARGYSLIIKGFLKAGVVDAALRQTQEMCSRGFVVPPLTVAQLFRTSCQKGRGAEIFEATMASKGVQLTQDAIVVLLEDGLKRDDLTFSLRVVKVAREGNVHFAFAAYDSLLKLCASHADANAIDFFRAMQKDGLRVSEGLCVGLLARCAESKFLRFAEEIVGLLRSRDGMTLACYSALMKVYAYCGMYDKACDLYPSIKEKGLEPDSMMYGCLMKYSVECGRTELSKELFEKSQSVQNYMSLIKAAGKDKDVDQAFAVLEKLQSSSVVVDVAVYNCVLDACVSTGDLKRARALIADMQKMSTIDLITYNTLLKGYCAKNDVRGAKGVLTEMTRAGFTPNDISYNCLINAAVSSGDVDEAWNTIDMMERSGVAIDHFTVAIMLKGMKKVEDRKYVGRALDLLDRSGVDVCSNEVLLNMVLETCTAHRHIKRLEITIANVIKANVRLSVHTYGSLIKACNALKRLDKCELFWHMMVDEFAMEPNGIVLGCMLDAYVCNDRVEDAVVLLNTWKTRVPPHTVMYSTIIKGFANCRQPTRALDMWRELRELGLPLNTMVYNALVDSQARVGAMDEVSKVVQSMEPNGCSPDHITYSMIVKGYCIKGDLDKALEIFRNMQRSGIVVNEIVYNTMLDGCTKHNRNDLVDLVLNDMEKHKVKPSIFTLGILVKMFGRRHQLDKAFETVEEFTRKHGLQLNLPVRTSLMCACISNQDFDRAQKVFGEIKRAGGGADGKTYGSLLSGLVRAGRLREAVALVDDAFGFGEFSQRGMFNGQILEDSVLEQLMRGLSRRQLAATLGTPLLERLRTARVPVNSRLLSSALQNGRGR